MTLQQKIQKLSGLANYDGSYLGDYWITLEDLYSNRSCMSPKFLSDVEIEICNQYDYAMEHFTLVKTESVITTTHTELKFED